MPLPTGLYKIAFETKTGTEYGVVCVTPDGRLRGGDSGMAYLGSYTQDGQLFSAQMTVTQHRHVTGAVSALGLHDMLVELHGLVEGDSVLHVRDSSPETAMVRFTARFTLIGD